MLILFVFLGSHGMMPITDSIIYLFFNCIVEFQCRSIRNFCFLSMSVLQCVHVSKDMQGYDRLRVMSRAPVNAKVSGHFFVSDVVHCGFLFVLF